MKRLQQIVSDKDVLNLGKVDKGFRHERIEWEYGNREKVFYKKWKKENVRRAWINFGFGILQDLFMIPHKNYLISPSAKLVINNRDRFIVATVMQWLGTNCGWCFLEESLKQCGYKIIKTDEQKAKENKEMVKRMEKMNKHISA